MKNRLITSILLIILLYILIFLYSTIGNIGTHFGLPHTLKTGIDNYIPFLPIFVIPYIIWILFPLLGILLIFNKKISLKELKSFYLAQIFLIIGCYLFYIFLPTTSELIMVDINSYNDGIFINIINFLYKNGSPYNSFPSYHVAPIILSSLFLYSKWKRAFYFLLPLFILIILATVFIKYHYFLDIIGGLIFGIFAYFIFYKKLVLKNKLIYLPYLKKE